MTFSEAKKVSTKWDLIFFKSSKDICKKYVLLPGELKMIQTVSHMCPDNAPQSLKHLRMMLVDKLNKHTYLKWKLIFAVMSKRLKKFEKSGFIRFLSATEADRLSKDKREKYIVITKKSLDMVKELEIIMKQHWKEEYAK